LWIGYRLGCSERKSPKMFLPTGDTPNPRDFRPYVNYFLIGANIFVYLLITVPLSAQAADMTNPLLQEYLRALRDSLPRGGIIRLRLEDISAYDLFVFAHGFKPGAAEISDLFSSMFLHANFFHLAGNMLFLWIYGDNVEHRLGRMRYVATYLATGIVATLFFALFAGESRVPLVGASGAISGVLGVYFVFFPRNRVKVFVAIWPFFFDVVLLPARWVLGLYLLVDNLLPFLLQTSSPVAYGAHIGGFCAGVAIAYLSEARDWRWPWAGAGQMTADFSRRSDDESSVSLLATALANGDREQALALVVGLTPDDFYRLSIPQLMLLADWLADIGHLAAAGRMARFALGRRPTGEEAAALHLRLGLFRLRQGQYASAYQHLLDVFDFDPDPQTAAQARALLAQYFHR